MNKSDKLIVAFLALLLCAAFYVSYDNNRKLAAWNKAHPEASAQPPQEAAAAQPASQQPASAPASQPPAQAAAAPADGPASAEPERLLEVSNDVARVAFTSKGGAIRSVVLPAFDRTLDPADGPVSFSFDTVPTLALSDLPGLGAGADFSLEEAAPGVVRMAAEGADGLRLERTVALTNGYHLAVRDVFSRVDGLPVAVPAFRVALGGIRSVAETDKDIDMGVDAALDGETPEQSLAAKLRDGTPSLAGLFGASAGGGCSGGGSGGGCAGGAGAVSPAAPLSARLDLEGTVGWIGVRERFFAQILTPALPASGLATVVSRKPTAPGAPLALDALGAELHFGPQTRGDGSLACDYSLYVGPRRMSELRKEGRDHLAVMRFGTWSFFCRYLLDILNAIHALIPSYGIAIIILTILVRLVLYPFTRKSMDSMKKMQELQPKVKALQEKYKDDKRKLQQEQMKLYAEAKVNPLSSCLPMLVQLPVFIALFMVLRTSVELRHESFLWIRDLSEPENLFRDTLGFGLNLLPIGMAVTMTLQSRLTPSAGDPSQQKMMTILMPVMMLVICYPFASALGLYWVVSQAIAIAALWRARRKGRPASFTQADGTEVIPPERETRQMRRERERQAEERG